MDTHYAIVHLPEVASTQDVARQAVVTSGHAALVVGDRQVAGRGRDGRTWLEPDAGLFSSFAFRTEWPSATRSRIPLCAAVAVRRSLPVAVDLKWPNDLLVDGRKVGGILVESDGDVVIVGCGLNLWWADAPPFAGAILAERPHTGINVALARAWVDALIAILSDGPDGWPLNEYEQACVTTGRSVRWSGGEGTAQGIREDGALIVATASGVEEVLSGDVHLLGGS